MPVFSVRRFKRSAPLAVGIVAIAVVLGCQTAAPAAAPPLIRTVSIDATEYAFNAPETLPAGQVTLTLSNQGHEVHHAQLLRLNDGVSFTQFASTLAEEGEAALRLTSLEGGPGAVDPHGSSQVTLDLKPGTYALACFIAGADGVPHLAKGMLKAIEVSAQDQPSVTQPASSGTFTMKDFAFDMPDVLPAGRATYTVANLGPQPHELNVLKLAPGKTAEDVLAWEKAAVGPPPFEAVGGMNGLNQDGSGSMTLDLQAGSYLAICQIPDAGSGVPHAHLGMVKAFTVRG